tara:strand:+ start:2432 stop:2722 length:291 start_codon:yes stop_codon:yes gene_type:complete
MTLDFVVDVLINILFLPLQVILIPIDALLANIPGLGAIPGSISAITSVVGVIPATVVKISGAAPILWNALFVLFVLWIGLAPTINVFKKVWAWVRP